MSCTTPDGSHFKFDMLADEVHFFPAAISIMSQTLLCITWFLRAGCDAILTGSLLKDKTSGHAEISHYELTEITNDYRRSPRSWASSNPANMQEAPGLPRGSKEIFFLKKNDPISSKIHLRNHNKKDKKLCSIVIEHIEMISEWCIQF